MNAELQGVVEDEIEKTDRIILAAEKWGKGYSKDPDSHAALIRAEAKLARQIRKVFRDRAEDIAAYVNWPYYFGQVMADFNVDVAVTGDFFDGLDSDFISITFDTIATATALGAQASEVVYGIPLGIRSSDAIIQDLTTERLAFLIGKRVDKSGAIVDNPNSKYRISDKTRNDVAKSIQTSISLGEDKPTAVNRLKKVINNTRRAEIIAQTEIVNAYGQGVLEFGKESGATGKEWQDVFATDVCAEYAGLGIVPLNYMYGGDTKAPAAHTGCRCNLRIVYANEFTPND